MLVISTRARSRITIRHFGSSGFYRFLRVRHSILSSGVTNFVLPSQGLQGKLINQVQVLLIGVI